jgi:hypothetical protein
MKKKRTLPLLLALPFAIAAALPFALRAADLEADLNSRYRGGWVIVKAPVFSSCDAFYNDNDASGTRVTSNARRRFAAGELAHVERVGVKRGRVDVFLDLAEQVLAERQDGPFTLYDPLTCKIQLKVSLPGRPDLAGATAALDALVELHEDAREAEASPAWNGRRREPYPPGYEKTLAAYQSWKAAQVNVAVQARLSRAIEEASSASARIRSDSDYLEGFAAGVEKGRGRYLGDCPSLIDAYYSPDTRSGKGSGWSRGYEDGQRLAYNVELARRLQGCFVPVPAPG